MSRAALGTLLHRATTWHDAFRVGVDLLAGAILLRLAADEWQALAAAGPDAGLRLVLGLAGVLAAMLALIFRFPAGNGVYFSFSSAAVLAVFFVAGPLWAALGMLAGNLLLIPVRGRHWRHALFYGAQWVVAVGLAVPAFQALGGRFHVTEIWNAPAAIVAAIAVVFVVNSGLVYWSFYHNNRMTGAEIAEYLRGDVRIYGISIVAALLATYCSYLIAVHGWEMVPVLALLAGFVVAAYQNITLRTRAEQSATLVDQATRLIWAPPGTTPSTEPGAARWLALPQDLDSETQAQILATLDALRARDSFSRATIWAGDPARGGLRRLVMHFVPEGGEVKVISLPEVLDRPPPPATTWPDLYPGLVYRAADSRELVIGDVQNNPATGIVSILAVPLQVADQPLGVLALESAGRYDLRTVREQQIELITRHLALFLARSSLAAAEHALEARTRAENRRLANELRAASRMQARLLPQDWPRLPGLTVVAYSLPAMEVGGDFYDYRVLPDGRLLVLLGDATGKGTAAVMQIAVVKSLLGPLWAETAAPGAILTRLNASLYQVLPRDGMTCFCALIDPVAGQIAYANAGHVYPYSCRDGHAAALEGSGLPLGMLPRFEYREYCLPFDPGTVLFIYSDGIVEAQNAAGAMFGFERLEALLARPVAQPTGVLRQVLDGVAAFSGATPQADDLSALVVRRDPLPTDG